ncbi:DNA mismatch repair endonuclease MutL [Deinococcus psychrotolerans]|uniref:DNA mismatch repair protein MutL n=1 Tax=Deinococcus psychrotolerans TaxID=2489213 RepID=A0A3G8Y953_9DEIO|nr:DNA mismatch repair endonuclease MutL [Deinococcus psychrotolerans]AZI41433.1 DNA mismatch repair endonuclease MutL [Deinococcus psychrotolerans]
MTIRLLPPETARLIAAGEVVSRPLDVVRELLDNALDAGASRIEIEVDGGGLSLIRVRDNGSGIPASDVPLSPLRHATSKLESVDRVTTLGFRGEALWAAAQAGQLRLVTRPPAQLGATLLTAHGDTVEVAKVSAPAGSTVSVSDLFGHLPARRRTQLPAGAELREITALVSRYVLHWPRLHWKLTLDGETRLLHATADHRGAVASVYGPLNANRVISVSTPTFQGVISRPELSRPRRDRMHFSVNGRPVLAPPELERAVIDGYAELLSAGHAPLCVLDLTLPFEDVNPNVHPAKAVVALADLPELCLKVTAAVQATLSSHPLSRPLPELRVPAPAPNPTQKGAFPALTLVGLYRQTYLLAEGEGDLWVIDAHAAHERVLYEELSRRLRAEPPFELPEPELLQLSPEQLARLHERGNDLRGWGLTLEEFGAGLVRLRSLPAALAALPLPRLHEQIIESALGVSGDAEREVLGRLACAPALKAGMLDQGRGEALLVQLAACDQPWSCPHGRPTVLRLSERDLMHSFGRRSVRDVARGRDETDLKVPLSAEQR